MGTNLVGYSWFDELPQMVRSHKWAKAVGALKELGYDLSKEELEKLLFLQNNRNSSHIIKERYYEISKTRI